MKVWERLVLNVRLSILRGHEQTLHNQIGQGYARGNYLANARREQQQVRADIRSIEKRLDGG